MAPPQDSLSDENQAEGQAEQRHAGEEDQSWDGGQTVCGEASGRASGPETGGGGERRSEPDDQVSGIKSPPPHLPHLPAAGCMKVPIPTPAPPSPVAKISSGSVMKSGTLPAERFWYRASFRATQIFIALLLTRPAKTESCSAGDSCLKLPESFC